MNGWSDWTAFCGQTSVMSAVARRCGCYMLTPTWSLTATTRRRASRQHRAAARVRPCWEDFDGLLAALRDTPDRRARSGDITRRVAHSAAR
jgi:hypothetical protein